MVILDCSYDEVIIKIQDLKSGVLKTKSKLTMCDVMKTYFLIVSKIKFRQNCAYFQLARNLGNLFPTITFLHVKRHTSTKANQAHIAYRCITYLESAKKRQQFVIII